jgi:hypothetical protein
MATPSANTFIVDCPRCKAKVAAIEQGRAERAYTDYETNEPYGERLHVGACPSCGSLLAGESMQVGFESIDSEFDEWSDVVRIFPKPPKTFNSLRVPRIVKESLIEADRSLQANANIAACVMLGRALEAVCRDLLQPASSKRTTAAADTSPTRPIMLGAGIRKLKEKNFIDDRLFDWSQQLQAFRNIAAHPTEESISREDAEDLHTFVYAIIEYIYDLTDRYNEFKERIADRAAQKAKKKK